MKNYLLYVMVLFLVFSMGPAFAQDENNQIEEMASFEQEELIAEEVLPDPTRDDSLAAVELWQQHEKDMERIPADEAAVPDDSTFLVVLPNAGEPPVITAAIAWDGGGDGFDWNDPLNWDLDQVPTNADDVTIGSGNSVQLIDGADGQCLSLSLSGNLVVGLKTLTVSGNVTIQSGGSLYLSGTIYLTGNWSNSGTFAANSGSYVRLNGAGAQSIDATNFYHLNLENAGTKTATGDIDVDGSFRIYPGVTFDPASYDLNIAANFENDGTLTLGTGTITMDGTTTQTIYSNEAGSAPGVWNFNNLIIAGNVGSIMVYDTLNVDGDLNVNGGRYLYLRHYGLTNPSEGIVNGNGGTFTLGVNSRLYIRTRRTNGAGLADDNFPTGFNTVNLVDGTNTSIVYYQSNSDQVIRSLDGNGDQITYGRIFFGEENSGNYPTKRPDGDLDINGYLYIGTNTTLDVIGNYTLNVGGYWYNYSTFTPRGGEVILDGVTQQITGSNSTTFTNLTIAGSGAKTLYQTTIVNSSCVVSAGVSYLNLRDEVLSGGGSSSFDFGANVILYVRATSNFPSFNSYTLDPTSIVRYDMSGAQSVKTGISYGSLYLDNGLKTADGVNYNLTVNGYLQMTGDATFDLYDGVNPFTLNVYGNYYNYGTIDIDNSTINLLGAQDVIFYGGGTGAGKPVYNLTVNKTGGMATLGSTLQINNNLNLTNGAFGMASTNRLIYINGNWTRAAGATFNYGTSTVYFQGASQTISGTGSDDFYNVDISGGTKTLGDAVDVNNNLTIQATGGLDVSVSNYDLFIGGTFNNNLGGSFEGQSGTVTFDGSNNANLYIGSSDNLYNMTLNKSAGSYLNYDEHDLSIDGNVLVQNGLLRQGTNSSTGENTDLLVYGNWTNYGTFRATQNDTVFFLGAAQTIIASGTDDFNNMVIGGTGTKSINSNIDANRTITINTGATLSVSGSNILTVGRDFINNGTFTANTSTLKFDEYAGWNPILLQTNGSSLYNLIVHVRDLNEDLDLVDNLTVLNDLTVERGDLDVTTNNFSITVGGAWTIESEGRFLANAGTVTFDGASAGPSETITSNSWAFNNMTISAANTTYRQQDQLGINGNLTLTSGTLNLNSNDLMMGNGAGDILSITDSLVVNTEARLRIANGASLTVNSGGYIDVVGVIGYPAVVTNQGSGSYSFDVLSGGNIAAQYYTFEFMDTDGINVQDGATINTTNDFSNGTFTNGPSGGTHLTIDNNQTFATINNVAFPTDPGGGASNVRKTLNQGSLTFVDASGAFQGDGNDDDNFGLISWTYGTVARQWNGSVSTAWNDPNNWTPASVPVANNRVDIPSAPSNQPVITTTTETCFHLTIQSGASLTLGGGGNPGELTVTGDVNLNGSLIFAVNDGDTLFVQGNWANSGTLTHNSRGAVVFTGPNDQNIASGGTGSGKTFYDIIVRKSGGKAILAQALKTDNDLSLLTGVFDVSSGNYGVEVGGNWLRRDVATFLYQAGVVTMSGASTSITGTGTDDFYSLTINGSGITLGSALNISRDLTINASSSLDATTTNYSMAIYRNWTNNGTFTPRSSNVLMNGVNQTVAGTATTTFYNITFANAGTKTINANMNVGGSLWLNAGALDLNANTVNGTGASNLFSMAAGTNLYVEGANNFPSSFENFSISATSYVRYNLAGDQTIIGTDGDGDLIEYGYLRLQNSGTKTAATALDVNGDVYIANNVTFSLNSQDLTVGRYWDNNQGGSFTAGSGNTVTFDNTGTQNIYPNSAGDTFPTLVFGGTGAKVLNGNIAVTGDLTMNSGITYLNLQTFTVNGSGVSNTLNLSSNVILYVRGAANFPTGFEVINLAINSRVQYDGNLAQTIVAEDADGGQIQYGDIYFRYNTKTLDGDLNARGRFYIYASTVVDVDVLNDFDITVGERWYNLGTTNLYNNTVTFNGSGEQILYSYGITSAKKFYNLVINKPADSYLRINTYDVQVDNNVDFTSGLMDNNRTVNVDGNWTSGTSAVMETGGTVTFNGADQTISGSGSSDFNDVNFNGTGTKTFGSAIDVIDDLTIGASATLDVSASNYKLSVRGDFTNSGAFTPQQGIVEFTGTANQYVYTNGTAAGKRFYKFKVNKTGGGCYLRGNLYVSNMVMLEGSTSGSFRPETNDITLLGSWFNTSPLNFIPGTGQVTLSGTTKDSIQTGYTTAYPNQFYDLIVDNPDSLLLLDNIRVDNSYVQSQGIVSLGGHEFYFGAVNNGGDVFDITAANGNATFDLGPGGQLKVRRGNTVNVASATNTSTIQIVGERYNTADVTYWGATQYGFVVGAGGRIYARHYNFSYMNNLGIQVDGGQIAGTGADTTADFSNGTFSNGVAAGRYLLVNNDQVMKIDSVDFSNSLGATGYNVSKPNDAGNLTFFNATGIYSGASYEDDPFDRIVWISNTTENTWEGDVSSDWHTAGNWSNNSVPTSTDNVVIPNVTTDPLISNNNADCASLTILAGGLLQMGNSRSLTAAGNFKIYGTLTIFGDNTISVGGDYENNGTLNPAIGTFVFNGIEQSLNSGGTAINRRFNNITITGTANVTLSTQNLQVNNNLTINSGASLDVSSSNRLIYIGGAWTNSGSFNYRAGTVTFNGSSAQAISGSGTNDFYNIQFSGGGAKTLANTIDINGTMTINSGATVNGGSSTVNLAINFTNNGTFNGNTGTVVFDREGGQNVLGSNKPSFNNITFAGTGNKVLAVNMDVAGALAVQSGVNYLNLQTYAVDGIGGANTFSLGSAARLYVRDADNFPANFETITLASDSYVRYDGNLTQTIRTKEADDGAIQYGNLELYHQGSITRKRILENGDLFANGFLTITTGDTLDVTSNNYNLTIGGSFNISGYLIAGLVNVANTVTMTGGTIQNFTAPGEGTGKEFYNLVINKSANYCQFAGVNNVVVNNDLTITLGELRANGSRHIYVKGDWLCSGGSFNDATSTIHFNPASFTGTIQTNNSQFYNVMFDGTTSTHNLSDNMAVMQDLTINSGNTLDLNGNTLDLGNGSDNITINGLLDVDAGAQLRLYNTASLVVNSGGRINVVGASGNIARVSRLSTTGSYSFEVQSGATIAAEYYLFEYMNQSGIYVNGATIDLTNNFSNGSFTNGITNGKFLNINSNNQNLTGANQIENVQFPSNPGGTSYNVYVTNSSSGSYNFEDASGVFEGEGFEYDPDGVVTWTYTTITRIWEGSVNSDWHTANNWAPQSVPSAAENVVITTKSNLPVISNNDAACNNLTLNGGSLSLSGGNNLNVAGNFAIASGATFTVNSNLDTVFLNGGWSNDGTYLHGNSLIVFQGDNVQNLTSGGTGSGKRFYNIEVDKGATAQLSLTDDDLRIDNDLTITSGELVSGSRTITLGGDWNNTGGSFNYGTGTVSMFGGESDVIQSNGSYFYNLTLNISGGDIQAQDDIRVVNDMLITAGTFYVNANEVSVGNATGDRISVQGILDINANASVKVQGGSDGISVETGGRLNAIGTSAAALAEITRYGTSGFYPIIFNSGSTLDARFAKFAYTNGSGVAIENGATISTGNKLADCIFENGSGNSYLRISNSQVLGTINNVTFGAGGSTPTHNVIYDGSGSVLFNNYKGSMAGSRFEDDNGTDPTGNVRWTFNENQSVIAGNTYTFGNDLDITVNTVGTLTGINVQLLDSRVNGYADAYSRNYVITTTPAGASGYDIDLLSYYADGTNNSNNEIPLAQDDTSPYLWVYSGGQNYGPYRSSNSAAQNWVKYTNITERLADTWFVSNAETDESLPVELSTYEVFATKEGVELNWITESELNNLKWKILRKNADLEEDKEVIAEIEGMGTISNQTAYNYLDEDIKVGTTYEYTLVSVSYYGYEVEEGTISVTTLMPEKFELAQNYPNPFNAGTTIKFTIPSTEHVEILIYNALGQKVQTLVDEKLDAGFYTYRWDGKNQNYNAVASGVYFYILNSKDINLVKKMVYLK